jgi:aryl-alcohol dehydrogenase-like predicted oxidoreductase
MITRVLGKTKLELSVIGLGTGRWTDRIVEKVLIRQNEEALIATILEAMEMGINWIDTAPSYNLGCSESIIGKAIKVLKKKPIISTKCGRLLNKGRIYNCLSEKSVRSEIESSLERLGIDAIDLYQIHNPLPDGDIEQAWSVIAKLVKERKIRYAGVSNFSLEQLKRVQAIYPVDFIEARYSMLFRNIEKDVLGYCADNKIGVMAYSPIEKGLLVGKFKWEEPKELSEHDHRKSNPLFADKGNFELIERLCPIAARNKMSMSQLAIAWVLRRSEIASTIVGARFRSQIRETAAAADSAIRKEDLAEIDILLKKNASDIK